MEVRSLEVFLSVAKHLNFTRAGEEVNLSQPSVSVRIRQLETELGVKLFEQLGKRVGLTEAGALLIPHARRVIAATEDAKHSIDELQGLERGSLRIGASTTPGMYVIPKTIALFKARYPKIEIQLGIKDTRQIEEGVARNQFDFGFVGGHLAGDEVDVHPWLTDQLVLIVDPGHALARKKSVNKSCLKRCCLLTARSKSSASCNARWAKSSAFKNGPSSQSRSMKRCCARSPKNTPAKCAKH